MPEAPTPLFLLSLPRSGSTLLQRILASHPEIATVSEPWVLLPFLYSLRARGVHAEYGHLLATRAIEDLTEALPGGAGRYRKEIGELALRLYSHLSPPGTRYFLDKTPRYHLIAEELFEIFPHGRFVFLWRNPLAIVASMIQTLGSPGRWDLYLRKIDLYDGVDNLIKAFRVQGKRAFCLRFEDLLESPQQCLTDLLAYLDLSPTPNPEQAFGSVQLQGRLGDRSGLEGYPSLSKEPIDKWRGVIVNPWRKQWCRSYLRWIGGERLATMGYDIDELVRQVGDVDPRFDRLASDITWAGYGALVAAFELHRLKERLHQFRQRQRVHVYS